MDQEDNKASYIQEIRKKYPKAGTKWEKEEDELLQKRYKEKRNSGFGDFELFGINCVCVASAVFFQFTN